MDVLTTSNINSLVESYSSGEIKKFITPLNDKKSKYQNISSAYTTLLSKLNQLKGELSTLRLSGTESALKINSVSSSNSSSITASAKGSAAQGSYSVRVLQMAKSDVLLSGNADPSALAGISGTHKFVIKTGDDEGGDFISHVEVTLTGTETNKEFFDKIRDSINSDKAEVSSSSKISTELYTGGSGKLKIDIGGTEKEIDVTGGGTYSELMDEIAEKINRLSAGVTAVKSVDADDPSKVQLKFTVSDSSKYISISNIGGNDVAADLGISVTKEKGASGAVTASSFSPVSGSYKLSLTSRESGLNFRIKEVSDLSGSTALNTAGINVGTARNSYDDELNTAGFLYSDITNAGNLLNAKITFNGISIQRDSNKIQDIADGITFNLLAVNKTEDADVNLNVSVDIKEIKSKIESFINKFNDVYTYVKGRSGFSSGVKGEFYGDANSSKITEILASVTSDVAGISSDQLKSLAQVGIVFDYNNGLKINNSTVFEAAIKEKMPQVEALFNSENGLAVKMEEKVIPFLGSEGFLSKSKDNFESNITALKDRINSVQNRVDKSTEMLRNRYERLQAQLAALLTTSTFFSSNTGSYF